MIYLFSETRISPKEAARRILLALGEQNSTAELKEGADAACITYTDDADEVRIRRWMARGRLKVVFK